MESTVIGVYDDRGQAEGARNELIKAGFGTADIGIFDSAESQQSQTFADHAHERADAREQAADGWGVGSFFSSLFGSINSQDADLYQEVLRRGSYLLTVVSRNDQQHAEIANIMDRYDPIDVDERSVQWREKGWSNYDPAAPRYTDAEIQHERGLYADQRSASGHPIAGDVSASSTVPRSPGDLQPGRRGAKVFQRTPSSVDHDVPAPGSPLAGGTLPPDATLTPDTRNGMGASMSELDNQADTDYRQHWQSAYGTQGGLYEDQEPAYQYGTRLAQNERYRAYSWEQLEPEARTEWEVDSSRTTWEKSKDAVRHAWERAVH